MIIWMWIYGFHFWNLKILRAENSKADCKWLKLRYTVHDFFFDFEKKKFRSSARSHNRSELIDRNESE